MTLLCLAVVALAVLHCSAAGLQSFDYTELAAPTKEVLTRLVLALTTTGALQVTGVPSYAEARKTALGQLADCLANEEDETTVTKMTMTDGSIRKTTHAATGGTRGLASGFGSACADSAADLRTAIDLGTGALLQALDAARVSATDLMRPYRSFDDIQRNGEHLEHMHVYWAPPSSAASSAKPTVDFHTDGGLFIAMTSGLYSSNQGGADGEGLYLELADGAVLRVNSAETQDNLVFLVGEAGSKWLAPVLGQPLRAVPHKLVAALPSGGSRAWYGKMYLPPADAFVAPAAQVYGTVREQVNKALSAGSASGHSRSESLPVACGPSSYLTSSTGCTAADGSAGVECWMQCMSTASLPCGSDAVCFDSATNTTNSGNTMCPSTCSLQCPDAVAALVKDAAPQWTKVPREVRLPFPLLRTVNEGLASDGKSWFFSQQHFLVASTLEGEVTLGPNLDATPQELKDQKYNHIGEIDHAEGVIFGGIEQKDGNGVQRNGLGVLAKWSAKDLSLLGYSVTEQDGMPWVAVDTQSRQLYSAVWNSKQNLMVYDMDTLKSKGVVTVPEPGLPGEIQGGAFWNGDLFLAANGNCSIYRLDMKTLAISRVLSDLPDYRFYKHEYEMEGIDMTDLTGAGLGQLHLFGNFMALEKKSIRSFVPPSQQQLQA